MLNLGGNIEYFILCYKGVMKSGIFLKGEIFY